MSFSNNEMSMSDRALTDLTVAKSAMSKSLESTVPSLDCSFSITKYNHNTVVLTLALVKWVEYTVTLLLSHAIHRP